jgi:hypothetical protein
MAYTYGVNTARIPSNTASAKIQSSGRSRFLKCVDTHLEKGLGPERSRRGDTPEIFEVMGTVTVRQVAAGRCAVFARERGLRVKKNRQKSKTFTGIRNSVKIL